MSSIRTRSSTSHRYIINIPPASKFWTDDAEMGKKGKRKQPLDALHQQHTFAEIATAAAPPDPTFIGQALLDALNHGDAAQAASSAARTSQVTQPRKATAVAEVGSKKKPKQKKKKEKPHPGSAPRSPIYKRGKFALKSKSERKKDKKKKAAGVAAAASADPSLERNVPEMTAYVEQEASAAPMQQTLPPYGDPVAVSAAPNDATLSLAGDNAIQTPLVPNWQSTLPGDFRAMHNLASMYWYSQLYMKSRLDNQTPYPWLLPVQHSQHQPGQQGGVPLPALPFVAPGFPFPQAQGQPWRQPDTDSQQPQMGSYAMPHHPMLLRARVSRSNSPAAVPFPGQGPPWIPRVQPVPVPKPSPEYLLQAEREMTKLSQPQRLLVVIDLNGTLVHRSKSRASVKPRPDLPWFLERLFANFTVMIWSSARPENVSRMCKVIFTKEQHRGLRAEWGRDMLGLSPEQYQEKVQVYKQLSRIWDMATRVKWHPLHDKGGRFGAHNTVLLDDSAVKASSEPYNLVEVPEYDGGEQEEELDRRVLRQVAAYLDELKWFDNASAFIKRNPFALDGRWKVEGPSEEPPDSTG